MLHFLSVAVLLGAMAERVKFVQTLRKGAKAHQVPLVPDNAGRERVKQMAQALLAAHGLCECVCLCVCMCVGVGGCPRARVRQSYSQWNLHVHLQGSLQWVDDCQVRSDGFRCNLNGT